MKQQLWLLTFVLSIAKTLGMSAGSSDKEVVKPDRYHNYLTCLALCGTQHNTRVYRTLLSGEPIEEWTKRNKSFDECDAFCQKLYRYPLATSKLEGISATHFDHLEVTCIERESLAPLRLRAKLHIHYSDPLPKNVTHLFVVEMWRAVVGAEGAVSNSLMARYFTFSDRFMASYTFSGGLTQEKLYIRVFAYTPDGLIRKPLCSGSISPDSLVNSKQKSLTLALKQFKTNESLPLLFLQWSPQDIRSPPECDQVMQVITVEHVETRHLTLDSSHMIPLPEMNENFSYKVKLNGLHTYQTNLNTESTSVIIIDALYDSEGDDWTQALVSYSGLILLICIIVLLAIVCICYFVCCRRKQRRSRKNIKPFLPKSSNSAHFLGSRRFSASAPHNLQVQTNQNCPNDDTITQQTFVVEEATFNKAKKHHQQVPYFHTESSNQRKIDQCLNPVALAYHYYDPCRTPKSRQSRNIALVAQNTSTPKTRGDLCDLMMSTSMSPYYNSFGDLV